MKNFLPVFFLLVVFISGCSKKDQGCSPVTPASEEPQILAYANANGITAVKHNSGIYYEVIEPGYGTTPAMNSNVYITYTAKLLNGYQFDQSANADSTGWPLGSLIEGFQVGLPLIKKGGRIKLFIPSSLAYSCNGKGATIPPNSVLYFDITLVDVTQGCKPMAVRLEEPQIKAYATANSITAVKDSSGIYYQVIDSGSGLTPTLTSKVSVTYTGKFLNGVVFDQSANAATSTFTLGTLIKGWQIGLPLIKKGGRIKLIVPSALGYGCNGAGASIPPNAVLSFDITLVDVQ
jgi:FKBP-type peptidyl-prolyl cis-trans isomerase FkpA